MKNFNSNNDNARNTSILLIAERFGLNTTISHSGNFFFEDEKNPSLHINISKNIFFYHGQNAAFTNTLAKNGGDVVDFTAFCVLRYGSGDASVDEAAKVYASAKRNNDMRGNAEFGKAMSILTGFITGVSPSVAHLLSETKGRTSPGAAGTTLSDYKDFSGGAFGADKDWDESVSVHGAKVFHYWYEDAKQSKPPYANTLMPADEIEEGKREAALAAARMYGYQYQKMSSMLLVRDWAQAKHADAVFAIAQIRKAGELFDGKKSDDDRVLKVDSVVGGTGYAANMAILHGKPVYVFNQVSSDAFPIGWYEYSKEQNTFISCDVPVLTKNFAGIGSRNLTDEGKKAIRACVYKTVQAIVDKQKAAEAKESVQELDYSDIKHIKAASTDDSSSLSILDIAAFRPFRYKGEFFISVEQFIQWQKAKAFGNEDTAERILSINSREFEYNPGDGTVKVSLCDFERAEDIPSEVYEKALSASKWCRSIGDSLSGSEEKASIWAGVEEKVIATGMHLSFISNAEASSELLKTGRAVLVCDTDGEQKTAGKPDIASLLMKERTYLHQNGFDNYRSGDNSYVVESFKRGVTDSKLVNYLKFQRGLSDSLLSHAVYEVVVYKINDPEKRRYTAIGTPTVEQPATWSIRFAPIRYKDEETGKWVSLERNSPKVSTGQNVTLIDRDYNFIHVGQEYNRSSVLKIFEGQLNAVADIALSKKDRPETMDMMTLNSTENYKAAFPFADQYDTVVLCLDNDKSGQGTTIEMAKHFVERGIKVFDSRPCFIEQGSMQYVVAFDPQTKEVIPPAEMKRRHETGENTAPWTLGVLTRRGPVPFESVWKDKVGIGPNDVNDRLILNKKITPDVKISGQRRNNNQSTQKSI